MRNWQTAFHATIRYTKILINKRVMILLQARIVPNKYCNTTFVKIYPYLEKL